MEEIDLRDSWNRLSAYYQERHSLPSDAAHYGVCAPDENQLRLLGDVGGKRILEIGCGGGQCSVAFARQGASCTGVDLSDEQIAHARGLAELAGVEVELVRADMLTFLDTVAAASYDVVFSAYALQYVGDLRRCFIGAFRALAPGGLFVFSLDHPLNDVTAYEDGRVVVASSYFDCGAMRWGWERDDGGEPLPFFSYHRTLADFANALADAGFSIVRMLEPEPTDETDPWAGREEFERYCKVPATLIVKARKPA